MATVTKDFRVKHGLVVEGTNATVDGSDIITEDAIVGGTQTNITVTYNPTTKVVDFVAENGVADSTTDDLVEGTTNKYFTDQRAIDAVGGSATPDNEPNTVVKRDANGDFAAGDITVDELSIGSLGRIYKDDNDDLVIANIDDTDVEINAEDIRLIASDDIRLEADDLIRITSLNGIIQLEASDGDVYVNGDGSDSKVVVRGTLNDIIGDNTVDGTTGNTVTDRISTAVSDHNDLTTGVHGVTGDVVGTTDSQTLSNKTLGTDLNAGTYKVTNLATPTAEADAATKNYVDSAISNLVDGAPALLDTLNELAAALGDDENFAATVATDIGTKVSKAGDSMTGELSMGTNKITDLGAPTNDNDAATKKYTDDTFVTLEDLPGQLDDYIPLTQKGEADGVATLDEDGQVPVTQLAHVTEAIDGLSTDDIEEGDTNLYFTDVRAVDALEAVVPKFSGVEVTDGETGFVSKQVAFKSTVSDPDSPTISFLKTQYRSAKYLVKIASGSHTEVSEILLTLDTSDNIAITEYAVVGTNGSLATISADVSPSDKVRLLITPTNANSTVTIMGTLLA